MDCRTQVTSAEELARVKADALMVVLVGPKSTEGLGVELTKACAEAVKQGDFERKPGKSVFLGAVTGVSARRVLLLQAASAAPKHIKAAFGAGLNMVKGLGVSQLAVRLAGDAVGEGLDAVAEALATSAHDAVYVYRLTKPSAPKAPALRRVSLLVADRDATKAAHAGLKRGEGIAAGITLARELANRPGNHCTPTMLANEARKMARAEGLRIEVMDRKKIESLGMGSFLAVAQGSVEAPRFIVMHYQGAAKSQAPLALVGKGITFDSGGISLKPGAGMDEMKFDMGGAASVVGTMCAIARLKPKVNVVGMVAACENMPSGGALKPGDVIKSMSGQTIEVLNTDAEGRLILCDALTYATRMKPAAIIDIATLTGACVIALGHHHTGMYATDDGFADELLAAGDAAGDSCWRMPLDEEYAEGLKSNFADVANIAGRDAGSVTAAMFLKRFVEGQRWAHLDIAGSAWKSGAAKGATGRPVGLLTHWVLSQAA